MSTDIPSHNLKEVIQASILLLDNPKNTLESLKKVVLGPDFPTGGELIVNDSDLDDIYENGIGNIKLRATYKHVGKEIIIDSLPYQATTTKIIEQIQNQIYSKKSIFIDSILDASDQDNPVRVILKIKGRTHKTEDIMSHLFFTTDLEKSYRVNMNMIGLNGKPKVKNLKSTLLEWIDFRLDTMKKKFSWELGKIKSRIHILEAYIIVYKNLNKILEIIRNEDDPKIKLKKLFKFTDNQYEAIINMKIRNLAKLQEINMVDELKTLKQEEKKISSLLGSKQKLKKFLKSELSDISKDFSRERKTKIITASVSQAIEIKPVVSVEPITAVLSKNGWIKSIKGHEINLDKINYKTGDDYLSHIFTYTDKQLAFYDQIGYVYNLESINLPSSRGQGEPLRTFFQIQDGSSVIGMTSISEKISILNMTNHGYGFICLYNDILVKKNTGKTLLKTKNSSAIKPIELDLDLDDHYLLITSSDYLLIVNLQKIPILPMGI